MAITLSAPPVMRTEEVFGDSSPKAARSRRRHHAPRLEKERKKKRKSRKMQGNTPRPLLSSEASLHLSILSTFSVLLKLSHRLISLLLSMAFSD